MKRSVRPVVQSSLDSAVSKFRMRATADDLFLACQLARMTDTSSSGTSKQVIEG